MYRWTFSGHLSKSTETFTSTRLSISKEQKITPFFYSNSQKVVFLIFSIFSYVEVREILLLKKPSYSIKELFQLNRLIALSRMTFRNNECCEWFWRVDLDMFIFCTPELIANTRISALIAAFFVSFMRFDTYKHYLDPRHYKQHCATFATSSVRSKLPPHFLPPQCAVFLCTYSSSGLKAQTSSFRRLIN